MMQGARILEEEFFVPRAREGSLAPVYWNAVLQTSQAVAENYGTTLGIEYNFFVNGRMNVVIPKREWDRAGKHIAEKLTDDPEYFARIERETRDAKQKIESFLTAVRSKDLGHMPSRDLIALATEIYSLFTAYDAASVFAWFVAGDPLKQRVSELVGIYGDDLDVLSLPNEPTAASKMERAIIESALTKEVGTRLAKSLAEKYYWVPFGYDGPTIWDEDHFESRIQEYRSNLLETQGKHDEVTRREQTVQKKRKEILTKNSVSADRLRLIHILQSVTTWTDERKMLEFPLFFWYNNVLVELTKRFDLSLIQLKYLFTSELADLEHDTLKLQKTSDQRISQEFMTISTNGEIRIADQATTHRIKGLISRQSQETNIRGRVACHGPQARYVAKVKVLSSSKECPKVEPGDILVAPMTTPDYVPAMNRALGFITDEGGVTCHAAIVAREMNKFCVIGTKIATKVLKDGDLVEVDAEKGTVTVLK